MFPDRSWCLRTLDSGYCQTTHEREDMTPRPIKTVSLEEAGVRVVTGKPAELLNEYLGYLSQPPPGMAGSPGVGAGETTQAVRRRLGAAATARGVGLTIRRTADTVYFWVTQGKGTAGADRASRASRTDLRLPSVQQVPASSSKETQAKGSHPWLASGSSAVGLQRHWKLEGS